MALTKLADEDKKISEEDLELLKKVTIDKKTGYAMKVEESGEVVPLTDDERTTLAKIVIELCLFMYSTYVKSASEAKVEKYRRLMIENAKDAEDEAEDLLPILKVANIMANKLTSGGMNPAQITKYIGRLAGEEFIETEDTEMEDEESSEEEEP